MTREQTINAWLLFGPLTLVLVAELALLFARPAWLAWLGYLPIGRPRRVLLTPAARSVLSSAATYRDAAAGGLSLDRLAAEPTLPVGRLVVTLDPGGRRATFRLPLGAMFALSGAVAVRLDVDRDAVTLRAAVLPTLAATGAAFFLPLVAMALADTKNPDGARIVAPVLGVIFVAVQLVGAFRTRRDFRADVESVMDALEERIAALG